MKLDLVGIRLVKERNIEYNKPIQSPLDMINIVLSEMQDLDREMCMTLNLDAKNRVLNAHVVSIGSLNEVVVDVKSVMKSALLSNACGIIMFHNHPSGGCSPSHEDIQVSQKVEIACKVMDISFLDHVIIGKDMYYSYRAETVSMYNHNILAFDVPDTDQEEERSEAMEL